jgi:phage-related protein
VRAALKAFEKFPEPARDQATTALRVAAQGEMADIAKPMKGLGSGVLEIALPYRGDAYRVVYAVRLGRDIWVVHAFQKKSKSGIKTPKQDVDLIRDRIRRLKEQLR